MISLPESPKSSAHLKSAYAGKEDASSRHLQERAEQFAEWLDLQAEVSDPRAGNIVEAEFHAPYLYLLNMETSSAPKIESKEFKEIVRVLEQSDVPGGQSIYDDYMTIMAAGARETKVQFHRQKMEAGGWNEEKEQTYLQELRAAHQKAVDAYDRLWQVDDRGQYDSVLNNGLDHMIGKDPSNTRDMNSAVGCMRGELRAIDLGYDSRHLYVLGQIGMQEQILKKKSVEWEKRLEQYTGYEKNSTELLAKSTVGTEEYKKNEETLKKHRETRKQLQSEVDALKEYKKDLDLFKHSVWNKRVNSKEEMEAAGKQVDDFFAAHQDKKYAFMQNLREGHATQFNYAKEAAKAQPVPSRDTRQTKKDYDATVFHAAATLTTWKIDEKAMEKNLAQVSRISRSDVGQEKMPAALDRECKEVADGFLTTVNKKISELEKESSKYPHAVAFQKALLSAVRSDLENYRAGIPMNEKSGYREAGFGQFFSIEAQIDSDCFQPEKLETTEKAVQEYGLDKHAEAFLKLQERYQAFEMGKDHMQPAERRQAYQDLLADKRAMVKTLRELQQKTANPTQELVTLFSGKKGQLDDFRGGRGLQAIINFYERDLLRMDDIGRAMEKFNSARAAVFTNESPEHQQMREAGEKVQENIKMLQSGLIKDAKTGAERTMTEQEREGMLKQTWASMKTLEAKTDQYIAHATKNGTKIPHTSAGKARLAGAMDLKNLNAQLKDQLGNEPVLKGDYVRDQKMTERTKKMGKAGAEQLAQMDQEVEKFAKMSQAEFHDQTPESMAYGLDKCEYQAARVIAIAAVEEAAMQGKVDAKDIQKQVLSNQKEIAKDPAFQKWIKSADTKSKMKDLGQMSAQEVRADFVKGMSKDMEKEKSKTTEKTKHTEKAKTTENTKTVKTEPKVATGP